MRDMSRQERKIMRRRMANAYLSSVVGISLLLLLIGVALLVLVNAGSVSKYLKESVKVSVLLREDASDAEAEKYKSSILWLPFVKDAHVVTREEGKKELEDMLGEGFLSVFGTTPVPVSVEITIDAAYMVPDSLAVVSKSLSSSPLVSEVDDQGEHIPMLDTNINRISVVFGLLVLLLLFVSFVLIGNMVRLSVYAKRFTVHTMKLVGATRAFIRRPFLKAAFVQALVSSVVASSILLMLLFALKRSFPLMYSIADTGSVLLSFGAMFVCGMAVCELSTLVVVNRLVAADKDDLYY